MMVTGFIVMTDVAGPVDFRRVDAPTTKAPTPKSGHRTSSSLESPQSKRRKVRSNCRLVQDLTMSTTSESSSSSASSKSDTSDSEAREVTTKAKSSSALPPPAKAQGSSSADGGDAQGPTSTDRSSVTCVTG